jgi:polysaccharide pyruvyl transferase WcaK-like protein
MDRVRQGIRSLGKSLLAYAGLQRVPRRALAELSDRGVERRDIDEEFRQYTKAVPFLEDRLREVPPQAPGQPSGAAVATSTVVVLNDCGDQGSFGTSALMDGLEVLLRGAMPGVDLRSVPSHWLIEAASLREFPSGGGLRQPQAVFPEVSDQFDEVADQWLAGTGGPGVASYLAKLGGADLVILNGEGSIFRTNVSAVRELFLVWFGKTRLGIPAMFANGSVHLTDVLPILPAMVRKSFGALDAVVVREPASLRNLRSYAPDVSARVLADSAYALSSDIADPGPTARAIAERIGGGDYFCYDPGHMSIDNRTPKRSAEYELIMELKKIVPNAVLIPSPPVHPHAKRLSIIADETGSINTGRLDGYPEYMALVKGAQFVVSGRHHDTILAAMMGCPTIAFASTSHKVHGACESIGLVGAPFDSTDLRSQMSAITGQAADYVSRREDLRLSLQKRSMELHQEALELGELARDVLTRNP